MAVELKKKNILIIGLLAVALVYLVQLFNLQILDQEYKITASNNAFRYDVQYPARGLVLDRNGEMLVANETSYDIMITPIEVKEFDTLDLCKIFGLEIEEVKTKLKEYRKNRRKIGYQSFPFVKQVPAQQYAHFHEKSWKFPGFTSISRTIRSYPFNAGGNLLGYITETDTAFLRRNPDYKMGDYIGRTGIEQSYEHILKGQKGYNIFLRDVHNQVKSSFSDGKYDKPAIPGKTIISSIDAHLQQYGELLMQNKVGSLVAIEPSTGEILTLVSSPGIDVSKLAAINKHYKEISSDPYKPMFNRATMSPYPPGSVFKLVNALVALEEGLIEPGTSNSCYGGYNVGRGMGCHAHPSPVDLTESIMMSCNTYYAIVFRQIIDNPKYSSVREGFERWRELVMSFGFGQKLGSDLPSEQAGSMPSSQTYDKIHGKDRWRSLSILSLSIGQGEIGTTPLHLANLAATLANRGYYYTPHLIKGSPDTLINPQYTQRNYTLVDTSHFHKVIDGMFKAVNSPPGSGATARIAAVPGLDICGKTGTSQNPHGKDHSVFICFAPRDNPKIAVAAYIENAGFGATWAAPIASLLIEKYLNGEISREYLQEYVTNGNLMQNVPIKKQ
ncbi:MAG: penicillin-binding transpeptidase domain-containing protein [Bacteroidales bacterium]|nr:penicillin-binding transpeptidase domain-containing protein [Bacteroidales bacterium]MDD3299862.1 penicillin-binding transpeptidase domain-containing protein [Bacteroidales bacterium]MDD3843028.1 penicillin-binding transpeptidase domain-containing protein [Bacteroidales bacterium]